MTNVPKMEFYDSAHTRPVVAGHDFKPSGPCSNTVKCDRCGLDGWIIYETIDGRRVSKITSYAPEVTCRGRR